MAVLAGLVSFHCHMDENIEDPSRVATMSKENSRDPVPPLLVGLGDRNAIVFFLSCFTNDWVGNKVKKADKAASRDSRDVIFPKRMDICIGTKTVFRLYFLKDLSKMALYFDERAVELTLTNPEVRENGCLYQRISPETRRVTQLNGRRGDYDAGHPFRMLVKWAANSYHFEELLEDVSSLFPESLLGPLYKRQQYDKRRRNFKEAFKKLPGLVTIYTTKLRSSRLQRYDENNNLFGLTWVLPWAAAVLNWAEIKCAMTDATFNVMRPYICEVLNIVIANESIPIAVAVFPSETFLSYKRLYEDVERFLEKQGEPNDLLTRLPLLSDQGAALAALVAHFHLVWKHCHRHLIENAGANSLTGEWMRRLLQSPGLTQAGEVADRIAKEITEVYGDLEDRYRNSEKGHLIHTMLYDLKHADDLASHARLAMWARWERYGCPTTTNSQESMHGQLNREVKLNKTFLNRFDVVQEHVEKRFETRDSDARRAARSVNQYHKKMRAPGYVAPEDPFDKAWWTFYKALHSKGPDGKEWMDERWKYPSLPQGLDLGAHEESEEPAEGRRRDLPNGSSLPAQLPDGWKPGSTEPPEVSPPPPAGSVDERDEERRLPKTLGDTGEVPDEFRQWAENRHFTVIAWNLVHGINRVHFHGRAWSDEHCRDAISRVFRLGAQYYPGRDGPVQPAHEIAWRMAIYGEYGFVEKAKKLLTDPPTPVPGRRSRMPPMPNIPPGPQVRPGGRIAPGWGIPPIPQIAPGLPGPPGWGMPLIPQFGPGLQGRPGWGMPVIPQFGAGPQGRPGAGMPPVPQFGAGPQGRPGPGPGAGMPPVPQFGAGPQGRPGAGTPGSNPP
jgi:hypothetical protein